MRDCTKGAFMLLEKVNASNERKFLNEHYKLDRIEVRLTRETAR